MTIGEELAVIRARFPGCKIVAFADLSTGLILASSTEEKVTQEKLDALCQNACHCLLGPTARSISSVFGVREDQRPEWAWQAEREGVRCFVKAAPPATEALCFVVSGKVPLVQLCESAGALLTQIAAEG